MTLILSKLMNEKFLRESLFNHSHIDKEREKEFYNRKYKIKNVYELYDDLIQDIENELFIDEIYIFAVENQDKDYFEICNEYAEVIHKTLKHYLYYEDEIEFATLYFMHKFMKDQQ